MLTITMYKTSIARGYYLYLVTRSHHDHQGSQSEQLVTFKVELLSPAISVRMWFEWRLRPGPD